MCYTVESIRTDVQTRRHVATCMCRHYVSSVPPIGVANTTLVKASYCERTSSIKANPVKSEPIKYHPIHQQGSKYRTHQSESKKSTTRSLEREYPCRNKPNLLPDHFEDVRKNKSTPTKPIISKAFSPAQKPPKPNNTTDPQQNKPKTYLTKSKGQVQPPTITLAGAPAGEKEGNQIAEPRQPSDQLPQRAARAFPSIPNQTHRRIKKASRNFKSCRRIELRSYPL